MQMQVCEEMLPLILEDAAEQVESPVTSSDVEDERLELHCRVMREGEVADATVRARERQAAVSSCGGEVADDTGTACGWQVVASNDYREVDGDAGEANHVLSPHVVDLEVCSSTRELLAMWKGHTPLHNDSQPSPTSWTLSQAGSGTSSTLAVCGLPWRKDISCGASRDHPCRRTSEVRSNSEVVG
ncbi:hypothetical protein E2C01_082621 [Portunus trituberculatus]|uniref:Uncharacterized protein n=1 Tax=Portunus trituberculatus TaxID=210409 RepID=A0A5B7J497_PORTR|nr:hypothetical protein [Portunus trituberculatus]